MENWDLSTHGTAMPMAMMVEETNTGSLRLPILSEIGPETRGTTRGTTMVITAMVDTVEAAVLASCPMYFMHTYSW